MRRVVLPKGSPRGGLLTQGTVLAVTSNPDRTSAVKRGLFLLDNVLGSPPAPPPPNIPALEEASKKAGKKLTVRESMVLHRNQPLCASCHSRMDPFGLALLENFNALGRYREKEQAGPIDASGRLITGEDFRDVRDVKRVLIDRHRIEFYRCLTEKLLTYALGRGLESYDVEAVDAIVGRIEANDGHSSALIAGIIESAPFQKRRALDDAGRVPGPARPSGLPRPPETEPNMTDRRPRSRPAIAAGAPVPPGRRGGRRPAGPRIARPAAPPGGRGAAAPGDDRRRRPSEVGLRLLPQRRDPGPVVADRRRLRLLLQADDGAA